MVPVVLDADVVVAWYQRRVSDLVSFFDLRAVHCDSAGTVDGYCESTGSCVTRVDYEVRLLSGLDFGKTVSVGVEGRWVGVDLADLNAERTSRYVDSVELDVDVVDSVLARHETDRVSLRVDRLDEAVIFDSTRRHDLKGK